MATGWTEISKIISELISQHVGAHINGWPEVSVKIKVVLVTNLITIKLRLSGRWLSGSAWPFGCLEFCKTNFSDQVQYSITASRTSNQAWSEGLDAVTYCKQ